MPTGAITDYIDVAQLTLYAFWIFFAGLIIYLRREDSREGYPLETDVGGRVRRRNFVFYPAPKELKLPHGKGSVFLPDDRRDTRPVKATRMAPWPGAAYVPTGNPMEDGVGPAAWAERRNEPELTIHGKPMIVPLRAAKDFGIAKPSRDPRGFDVVGFDGVVAGKVSEVWIDVAEQGIRHLEVELTGGRKTVILPITFARLDLDRPRVTVAAIKGSQFDGVPTIASNSQITRYEEERIMAYYGGGYLYADPKRAEPLV